MKIEETLPLYDGNKCGFNLKNNDHNGPKAIAIECKIIDTRNLRDNVCEILNKISENHISASDISFKISSSFEIKTIIDDISAQSFPFTDEGIEDFIYFRKKREHKEF